MIVGCGWGHINSLVMCNKVEKNYEFRGTLHLKKNKERLPGT